MIHAVRDYKELVDAVSDYEKLFDAVSDPKRFPSSDQKVSTYNTNRNSPHKLLVNSEISAIIQGVIPPVHQATEDGVLICGGALHAVRKVLTEEIITGAAFSSARVFKDPPGVNWKVTSRPIPTEMSTVGVSPISSTQVMTGSGTSEPPIRIRSQGIGSPRGSIVPQKVRNANPFKTSIYQLSPKHGHPTPIFSKVMFCKIFPDESANIYARKRMDFRSNYVVAKIPNFIDFGLSPANTPYKLKCIIFSTTKVGRLTNCSYWLLPMHDIEEVRAEIVS